MMKKIISLLIVAACSAFVAISLIGCASASDETAARQAANRECMAQINQTMTNLNESLATFNEAVDRGDAVAMRIQADRAFERLDDLSNLEVPDELKDIYDDIVAGCEKLEEALNGYIDLYLEVDAAGGDIASDQYASRLAEVQKIYDEGIELLQKADKAASEL